MSKVTPTAYPLIVSLSETIQGNNTFIGLNARAWVLVTEQDGEFWAEGVSPGGVAAGGNTLREAYAAFLIALKGVLLDMLIESTGPHDFVQTAEAFFAQESKPARDEFESARAKVIAGEVELGGATTLEAASNRPKIDIEINVRPSAKHNALQRLDPPLAA